MTCQQNTSQNGWNSMQATREEASILLRQMMELFLRIRPHPESKKMIK